MGTIRSLGSTINELPGSLHGGVPLRIALSDQGILLRQLHQEKDERENHRERVARAALEQQMRKEAQLVESLAARDGKLHQQHQSRKEDIAELAAARREQYEARLKSASAWRRSVSNQHQSAILSQPRRGRGGSGRADATGAGISATVDDEDRHSREHSAALNVQKPKSSPHPTQQHHKAQLNSRSSPSSPVSLTFRDEDRRILQAIYKDTAHHTQLLQPKATDDSSSHRPASALGMMSTSLSSGLHHHRSAAAGHPLDLQSELRRAEDEHLESQHRMQRQDDLRRRRAAAAQLFRQQQQQQQHSYSITAAGHHSLSGTTSSGTMGGTNQASTALRQLAQPLHQLNFDERSTLYQHKRDAKDKKLTDAEHEAKEYHAAVAEHRQKHAASVEHRRSHLRHARVENDAATVSQWKQKTRTQSAEQQQPPPPKYGKHHVVDIDDYNGSAVWGRVVHHVLRAREQQYREQEQRRHVMTSKAGERWLRQL